MKVTPARCTIVPVSDDELTDKALLAEVSVITESFCCSLP